MTNWGETRRSALSGSLVLGLCLALSGQAVAEDATSHRDHMPNRPGRRPPPEAFNACQGKSEGSECSVSFRDRTLEGVCVLAPDEQLFCLPNDMPPPPAGERPDGPPPDRNVM